MTAATGGDGGDGTRACSATYTVTDDWGGGFNAEVKVTNSGNVALSGWKVAWTFTGDQKITNSWNATVAQSGQSVTATNAAHNGTLSPGASATFGLGGAPGGGTAPAVTCTAA
ncbi:hypothetical protein GCM10020256_43220 [Streptomyces thermocoprophilus]